MISEDSRLKANVVYAFAIGIGIAACEFAMRNGLVDARLPLASGSAIRQLFAAQATLAARLAHLRTHSFSVTVRLRAVPRGARIQAAQRATKAVPHSTQNFACSGLAPPHFVQFNFKAFQKLGGRER